VARRAGVSIATVSRVLNDVPGQVGAATRQRVRRAIRDLDFRPNALARSLHQKRTRTIGLIIPDISNPYYAEIARGIEDALSQQGYSLFTCNTDRRVEKISQYAAILREKRVDGIILGGGATWEPRHFAALRSSGVEAVLIGRYGVSLPAVRVDNVKGAWLAASHLLGLGHRDIAVIAGPRHSTTTADRLAGYRGAFAEHGVRLPASRCLYGDLRPESGRRAAETLLRARRPPTAVLAANDQMAIGAIRALLQRGLAIPADVSVVGFDDIALASFITPALTTMALPLYRMGVAAADMMLHSLAGDRLAQEAWFTPELVVRESSGMPPGVAARRARASLSPARTADGVGS
jgi:LacI family transcriptional regulator